MDAQIELLKMFNEALNEPKEVFYQRIRDVLNIDSFMAATENNTGMLFKYMYSPTNGIRLSNVAVGEFIRDEYGDDFYLKRELLRNEEYEKGV